MTLAYISTLFSVPEQEEFTMCPFSGGFDFHAVMGDSGEVRDNPFIMVVDVKTENTDSLYSLVCNI